MNINLTRALLSSNKPLILIDDIDSQVGYLMGTLNNLNDESVNFMINHGRGLVYVCITEQMAKKMELPSIGEVNNKSFTVSVDYKTTTTGISPGERADTMKAFLDSETKPEDFKRPGHVFPIVSKKRKLLDRIGVAEAAVMVAELTSNQPIAYVCEILNTQGDIANKDDIEQIRGEHGLHVLYFSDILAYQYETTEWLEVWNETKIDPQKGIYAYTVYNKLYDQDFRIFINRYNVNGDSLIFYTECQSGDLLNYHQCTCKFHFKDYFQLLVHGEIDAIVFEQESVNNKMNMTESDVITNQVTQLVKSLLQKKLMFTYQTH